MEKIQKDLAHNHRLIPVQELEEKAVVLKQLGETLTDLKGEEEAGEGNSGISLLHPCPGDAPGSPGFVSAPGMLQLVLGLWVCTWGFPGFPCPLICGFTPGMPPVVLNFSVCSWDSQGFSLLLDLCLHPGRSRFSIAPEFQGLRQGFSRFFLPLDLGVCTWDSPGFPCSWILIFALGMLQVVLDLCVCTWGAPGFPGFVFAPGILQVVLDLSVRTWNSPGFPLPLNVSISTWDVPGFPFPLDLHQEFSRIS